MFARSFCGAIVDGRPLCCAEPRRRVSMKCIAERDFSPARSMLSRAWCFGGLDRDII